MSLWSKRYETWFGVPYLENGNEAQLASRLIKRLKCRPRDLLAYVFRMWINTKRRHKVRPGGFDPFFYQVRGSRDANFFLKHLREIAREQKKPLDECLAATPAEMAYLATAMNVILQDADAE